MRRLPLKYKKILKIIFEDEEFNMPKLDKKTPHRTIMKAYTKINKIFKENGCDIYEINSIINSEKINNDNVKKLRKFVYLKNKNILKEAANTQLWENNIKNIMNYCKDTYQLNLSFDLTESAFLELEKKFVMNWLGFWSTIDVSKNGKIKNIDMFDMTDYEFIIDYLKNVKKNNMVNF